MTKLLLPYALLVQAAVAGKVRAVQLNPSVEVAATVLDDPELATKTPLP